MDTPVRRRVGAAMSGYESVEGPVHPVEQAYSTDGLTDRFVHRPCARPLVRLLMRLPVTPNAVTLAGLVLGVIAAAQFWYATPQSTMLGLLLFFLQAVVDHADGELARLTGQVSEFGRRLDVSVDTTTDVLVVMGMAVTATPGEGAWTWVLASLGGCGVMLSSLFTNFLPPPADRPVTRVTLQLANRDPLYFMLVTFLLLLWAADRFLLLFVWIVVISTNVYWFVHVIQNKDHGWPLATTPSVMAAEWLHLGGGRARCERVSADGRTLLARKLAAPTTAVRGDPPMGSHHQPGTGGDSRVTAPIPPGLC